jgi:8-oxo-dGTP pyrophosphatase MutT (NUDIX family)
MVRRKDSYGFVCFIRGTYNVYDKILLDNIASVLTNDEKHRLLTDGFAALWSSLWGDNDGFNYRGEQRDSCVKFEQLKTGIYAQGVYYNLESIIKDSSTNWDCPEWGFPKGRRNNNQEGNLTCAMREFEEETGYDKNKLILLKNVMPFSEICIGSNYKLYKHSYYVANMNLLHERNEEEHKRFETAETSEVKWFTYEDSIKAIRPYNKEKIDILTRVDTMLKNYTLYS